MSYRVRVLWQPSWYRLLWKQKHGKLKLGFFLCYRKERLCFTILPIHKVLELCHFTSKSVLMLLTLEPGLRLKVKNGFCALSDVMERQQIPNRQDQPLGNNRSWAELMRQLPGAGFLILAKERCSFIKHRGGSFLDRKGYLMWLHQGFYCIQNTQGNSTISCANWYSHRVPQSYPGDTPHSLLFISVCFTAPAFLYTTVTEIVTQLLLNHIFLY